MPQTRRRRYRARGRRWAANEPIKQTINQSSSELCLFILLFFLEFFPPRALLLGYSIYVHFWVGGRTAAAQEIKRELRSAQAAPSLYPHHTRLVLNFGRLSFLDLNNNTQHKRTPDNLVWFHLTHTLCFSVARATAPVQFTHRSRYFPPPQHREGGGSGRGSTCRRINRRASLSLCLKKQSSTSLLRVWTRQLGRDRPPPLPQKIHPAAAQLS